jgi:hypothetical protein
VRAVPHDQTPAVLVAFTDELGDVGVDLGLQRLGQHPAGTLTDDLIDQRRRSTGLATSITAGRVRYYGEHRVCLPDRRWRVGHA